MLNNALAMSVGASKRNWSSGIPADEAQAKLLIMEQSLIAMTRYLQKLVAGFEGTEPSPSKRQVSKHRGFTPKPIGER